MKKVFLVFLSIILLTGCAFASSKELSRDKAKSLLSKETRHITAGLPKSVVVERGASGKNWPFKQDIRPVEQTPQIKFVEILESQGYISVESQRQEDMFDIIISKIITPTPKLQKYILSSDGTSYLLNVGSIQVTKITGITKKDSGFLVQYKAKYSPNEIGILLTTEEEKDAYDEFILYDDGWRLVFYGAENRDYNLPMFPKW